MPGVKSADIDTSLFQRLVPYVYGPRVQPTIQELDSGAWLDLIRPEVPAYRNPADPSWDCTPYAATVHRKCSYALNMCALDGLLSFSASLPDGTSHTIAFADKFAVKERKGTHTINLYYWPFDPYNGEIYGDRRPTFADRGWKDVLPVTDPATGTTRASVPGKTFQVRPRPEEVDASIPQSPHRAGLTVALFDGSVRSIAPSVHETVFWSMVTPAGREVVNPD